MTKEDVILMATILRRANNSEDPEAYAENCAAIYDDEVERHKESHKKANMDAREKERKQAEDKRTAEREGADPGSSVPEFEPKYGKGHKP